MPSKKGGKGGKAKGKGAGPAVPAAAKVAAAEKRAESLQVLSPKLHNIFKSVLIAYEHKQYKKALKLADSILKVNQHHGETLAMKGITTKYMDTPEGMTEETKNAHAEELIKLGLNNNMKSHVCWHVYGLFHRHNKNYEGAIKSYKTALRLQKGDIRILRDLCCLQAQVRDYKGYLESRQEILQLRPTNPSGWLAFIVAQHINKDFATALTAVESYRKTLQDDAKKTFDYSELCYLESEIFIAKGDYKGGLAQLVRGAAWRCSLAGSLAQPFVRSLTPLSTLTHLLNAPTAPVHTLARFVRARVRVRAQEAQKRWMRDQVRFRERKAWLLMTLRRFEEASAAYISLFKLNPENYDYHRGYQCALLQRTEHWHVDGGMDLPIYHEPRITEEERQTLHAAYVCVLWCAHFVSLCVWWGVCVCVLCRR
jgi:tetratricopeptide (TPR) repeat protein